MKAPNIEGHKLFWTCIALGCGMITSWTFGYTLPEGVTVSCLIFLLLDPEWSDRDEE